LGWLNGQPLVQGKGQKMGYKIVFEIDKRNGLAKYVNYSDCCDSPFVLIDGEMCCKKCLEKIWSD
jgi:hypothetical protein